METIIYESNFEKFVESCIQSDKNEKDHYVGLGNIANFNVIIKLF